mmetsp:Transcript_15637/g.31157  ORF Transcript_15637/g.31157 Transcript_15637/m.31157 type:complete len:284 (+) Transcript_15637:654-1505(+)
MPHRATPGTPRPRTTTMASRPSKRAAAPVSRPAWPRRNPPRTPPRASPSRCRALGTTRSWPTRTPCRRWRRSWNAWRCSRRSGRRSSAGWRRSSGSGPGWTRSSTGKRGRCWRGPPPRCRWGPTGRPSKTTGTPAQLWSRRTPAGGEARKAQQPRRRQSRWTGWGADPTSTLCRRDCAGDRAGVRVPWVCAVGTRSVRSFRDTAAQQQQGRGRARVAAAVREKVSRADLPVPVRTAKPVPTLGVFLRCDTGVRSIPPTRHPTPLPTRPLFRVSHINKNRMYIA